MQIHALWCHPRSVSTAFERIMRERGDLDVLHEPFMYEYYLNQANKPFADFTPEPDHPRSFNDIRDMIVTRAQNSPVFFKDMAYYVLETLPRDPEFLHRMSHCFLIRDPVESVVSYYRRDPAFTLLEVGLEAQWLLYEALRRAGLTPLVINADDLRTDPVATLRRYWTHIGLNFVPGAFTWDDQIPEGWQSVKDWHASTMQSGAIQPGGGTEKAAKKLRELSSRFTDYVTHHQPFYERLSQVAHRQRDTHASHQK